MFDFSNLPDVVTRLAAVIFERWPPPSETAHVAALRDGTHPPHHALGGGLRVQLQQICSIKSEEA